MTMDGMEIIGSQAHAATSPFLLSSPPLRHHHTTFNLQTVQLSFDACLTYNTSGTCSSNNSGCMGNVNIFSGPSTLPSNTALAAVPAEVTISPATALISKSSALSSTTVPTHQQCTISGLVENHEVNSNIDTSDFKKRLNETNSLSTNGTCNNLKKRRLTRSTCDDSTKVCSTTCAENFQTSDEKDKTEELNTPITTSSDLPTFFGPAAFVEPPPISGTVAKF